MFAPSSSRGAALGVGVGLGLGVGLSIFASQHFSAASSSKDAPAPTIKDHKACHKDQDEALLLLALLLRVDPAEVSLASNISLRTLRSYHTKAAALTAALADATEAAISRSDSNGEEAANFFPPNRPDLEVYSQMLAQGECPMHTYEMGGHVYLNGEKLYPTHTRQNSADTPFDREKGRPNGFRVVQFDRSWRVLTDKVYEIYHDYDKGGDSPMCMRDDIAAMKIGNPVIVATGDASGPCDGSSTVCAMLREGLGLLGAKVFLDEFRQSNTRAHPKPLQHHTIMRFAYAALLLRGGSHDPGDAAAAAGSGFGTVEKFEDCSMIGCAASIVLCASPDAPGHVREKASKRLLDLLLPPIEPVPEGIFDCFRCRGCKTTPLRGCRYDCYQAGKGALCEKCYQALPSDAEKRERTQVKPSLFAHRVAKTEAAIHVGAMMKEIERARREGVSEDILQRATRLLDNEKARRARTAVEINIRAVAGEGAPADLLKYLRSLNNWVAKAKEVKADVESIECRFEKERPGAMARLQAALSAPGAVGGLGGSVASEQDLVVLERAVLVAEEVHLEGGVVASARQALASWRERRKQHDDLEAELLAFQRLAPADVDDAAAEDLLRRARDFFGKGAGEGGGEGGGGDGEPQQPVVQAAERHWLQAQAIRTRSDLEAELAAVVDALGPEWRADILAAAAAAAPTEASQQGQRYVAEALVFGLPVDAARGLAFYCDVSDQELNALKARGIDAIQDEFERLASVHHAEGPHDLECLEYVLHREAGSSMKAFQGGQVRDCDADGRVLENRQVPCDDDEEGGYEEAEDQEGYEEGEDEEDGDGDGDVRRRRRRRTRRGMRGMRLQDFVRHPSSVLAGLTEAEVAAVRLYSTAAYKSMNDPLRDVARHAEKRQHPLAATVSFLQDAVKKLRAVDASSADRNTEVVLWRGMANRTASGEFLENGGTELAPMSTTLSLKVAVEYSGSRSSVLLRLRTHSFMARGADIGYLSAFEGEKEVLFPPLTYLKVVGESEVKLGDVTFSVIDIQPLLS